MAATLAVLVQACGGGGSAGTSNGVDGGGGACSSAPGVAIVVTILDVKTNASICNATVTETLDGSTAPLTMAMSGTACSYTLTTSEPGSYAITATADHYGTTTTAVDVSANSCGGIDSPPQQVTMKLSPES